MSCCIMNPVGTPVLTLLVSSWRVLDGLLCSLSIICISSNYVKMEIFINLQMYPLVAKMSWSTAL